MKEENWDLKLWEFLLEGNTWTTGVREEIGSVIGVPWFYSKKRKLLQSVMPEKLKREDANLTKE
jgi:hypothetical protein